MLDVFLLIIGAAFLIKGADFFVDGASNIAKLFKIPPLIIGLTVVAFGTSAPEASVSVTASLKGLNDISFGNIIGSNLMNTMVILGVSAVFAPIIVKDQLIKKEIPFNLLASFLLIVFFFVGYRTIGRIEGAILLSLFILFILFLIKNAKDSNLQEASLPTLSRNKSILFLVLGMAGIVLGGRLVTDSASNIAIALGMSEILVGLTIVALGTSLPELITSVVAAIKKENDIALGNIIGSNIFNILLVLGLSAVISPMHITASSIVDLSILFIITSITLMFAFTGKKITRTEGFILLVLYGGYLAYIIARN